METVEKRADEKKELGGSVNTVPRGRRLRTVIILK